LVGGVSAILAGCLFPSFDAMEMESNADRQNGTRTDGVVERHDGGAAEAGATAQGRRTCCDVGGTTHGTCLAKGDAPRALASRLETRECSGADQVCVPTDSLDTNARPTRCGDHGVCVSTCLTLGMEERFLIDPGGCREDQRCVPCLSDPILQMPTGAPGCDRL
jgi:hypothetical protein